MTEEGARADVPLFFGLAPEPPPSVRHPIVHDPPFIPVVTPPVVSTHPKPRWRGGHKHPAVLLSSAIPASPFLTYTTTEKEYSYDWIFPLLLIIILVAGLGLLIFVIVDLFNKRKPSG
jgi:hypothetical protein